MTVEEQLKQMQAQLDQVKSSGAVAPAIHVQPVVAPGMAQPMQPGFAQPAQNGFGPPVAMPMPVGLLVPVSMRTAGGEVTVHVQFGPEAAANGQQAAQVVAALVNMGWPVKAWQPKPGRGGGW